MDLDKVENLLALHLVNFLKKDHKLRAPHLMEEQRMRQGYLYFRYKCGRKKSSEKNHQELD